MKIILKALALFISVFLVILMVGCDKKSDSSNDSPADESVTYEYEYRDLVEPIFIEAADSFLAGNGTEENPYQISRPQELAYLSELINDAETDDKYRKAYYELSSDIVINEGSMADIGVTEEPQFSWNPIGVYGYEFKGSFDGAGHTIKGVYINVDCRENKSGDRYGLFGNNDGIIKNVNIENSYICISGVSKDIGSIAGRNGENGVIENCTSDAIINCYDAVCGGIVGENRGIVKKAIYSGNISEIREYTFNLLGGVVGRNSGEILDCVNNGGITSGIIAVEYVGGIVGYLTDGRVENCVNNGILDCNNGGDAKEKPIDTYGNEVGGIVGCLFSSNVGPEEYRNKDIFVINCINKGEISGGISVAGIVATANNSGSEYSVEITNCVNNGNIVSEEKLAGIIAEASCSGAKFIVSNCTNTANISGGLAGGIISRFTPLKGSISVKACENLGEIASLQQCSGGIICSMNILGDVGGKVVIEECSNTGKIITFESAGGIIGFINSTATSSISDEAYFKIIDCINKGEVFTFSSNSFIGGIVGGFGVKGIFSEIADCINVGMLTVDDKAPTEEMINSDKKMNLSRMCGGIVGRIGETLYLSTSADKGDEKNVNAKNATIKIVDCYSNGEFNVPAEDKYKNYKGEIIWENQLGGIIGNCSAAEGYAFFVDNCGFANVERGLGTKIYKDVGELLEGTVIEKNN